ncbi:hypothetical protein [Otariodibacter oris]|uniref:Uncharacterized protein n=1 Tax=Otariodibacter oris TaxID=1032623 RepID=A0A420XHJ1_9PAST|nr:hypothetical protein [Otariodibacter oris]QGM81003.1 hypothetical protein A6A10_06080 [Otariodibacter oris]RKR76817.1 hypothetical protein DES31_0125 [Otariodibacter oris]
MIKDKGYDEFLAQEIELGLKNIEQGNTLTLEQSKMVVEKLLTEQISVLETLDESTVIYG